MVVFPTAKINLGLNVIRRRADGYHDISTVMVPIPLCDVLEAIMDRALPEGEVIFTRTGLPVPGDPYDDLCVRAVELVRRKVPVPGLRIHLHKAIPIGAGLGGGSSDAACMLLLLNELLDAQLGDALHAMAAQLGSDVPFFLRPIVQLAEGRGERLRPVDVDLAGKWVVLIQPGIHVATAPVYQKMTPTGREVDLEALLQRPIGEWQNCIVNTMEEIVFKEYPQVGHLKQQLLAAGAEFAAMSGSGSTVFGIFSKEPSSIPIAPGVMEWKFQL